jgi:hypothetical protein
MSAHLMASTIKCLNCDAKLSEPVGPCPHCGGIIEVSIALSGHGINVPTGQLGTVAESTVPFWGRLINYTAPTGSKSSASFDGEKVAISVEPPIDIGRPGEARVLSCIVARLAIAGKQATKLIASDDQGEDGVLLVAGDRVTVQIVTASPNTTFWSSVARGSGAVHAKLPEAAGWIYKAIAAKAQLYSNENKLCMLLAIDLAHMGVLAGLALTEQYLRIHGDPSVQFNFGAVWLIGPTELNVVSLGSSRW